MSGTFLTGDLLAHAVTFGDFMAGYFLAGNVLGGYHFFLDNISQSSLSRTKGIF